MHGMHIYILLHHIYRAKEQAQRSSLITLTLTLKTHHIYRAKEQAQRSSLIGDKSIQSRIKYLDVNEK
jgi:hypothetical protein